MFVIPSAQSALLCKTRVARCPGPHLFSWHNFYFYFTYLLLKILFIFLERGWEEEREKTTDVYKKHPSVVSCTPPKWGRGQHPRHVS